MPPQRADLVLAADVPDVEFGILICDGLDVEADSGDSGDILVKLELVKDGCEVLVSRVWALGGHCRCCQHTRLSSGVEAQHQQPHLL